MNDETRLELCALDELASPYRFRTGLSKDGEANIFGFNGVVEWHSFSNKVFAAYTTKPGTIRKLQGLSWARLHQEGDRQLRVLFPRERFPEMAAILKLMKKRPAAQHLQPFHFEPRLQNQNRGQIFQVPVSS